MHIPFILRYIILAVLLVGPSRLLAQDGERHMLPDDPAMAWAEVQKVHQALRPPVEWRTNPPTPEQVAEFQMQVRQIAVSFADKAREFVTRFPTNENVGDARITVVHALNHGVAAGDVDAEQQIAAFVSAVLADSSIPEDERVGVLLYAGNAAVLKQIGMRLFTEGMGNLREDFETASIENMRAVLKQFPGNSLVYTGLVAIAQRSTGERRTELATEIINAPDAPPGAKTLAEHILNGTQPYGIGMPLDIQFTALDGREVDLVKMKGKVVLVKFWSTTCGPCIVEMPAIKAVYQKLHERGFEIVAISLDDKESALRRFLKEQDLPWPQHFDGNGWENEFAVRYGVFSMPTSWLVDKRGILRDTDARYDLERRVTALLEEPTPSATE